MSVKLTDFESNLLRLCIVWGRVMTIYKEYPNHMKKGTHELMVRHLFREVTVEQLHNFLKIRKDLLQNPDFKKLDDIIKVLVEPILDNEKPIKELRHNYVAHIQEKGRNFDVMMNDIIVKYNLPTAFSFYRYMTGLVFYYCGIIERNFSKEWNNAMKKYDAKLGVGISVNSGFKMNKVD
ncbi:MAG: hypothetical protein GWN01_16260, partial [Nitrosopumilaceae archaeon]|nr:hypothetical protein [Nitrosopumilaceae archaeon]NIU02391.1 hypothetical protein [Nitrosopumilaceae archaeon]NIU88848.1 hypothetical protein [Nitrosopumilaceae archaeon]NIV66972.1 hypothetical protein [Nitrosopumilaceae archaeon]NIX62992.1 hypothetical protein [Nitrosopumilaceae archaeon]